MFFGRKESHVKDLIHQQLQSVQECLEVFSEMMEKYLKDEKGFRELSFQVHETEHEADKIRRKIETEIYEGAFMPAYRGDYISLIELIDKLANRAETISDFVAQQKPEIPSELKPRVQELTDNVVECLNPLLEIIKVLDQDWEEASSRAQQVENSEQKIDEIEWKLIRDLFEREDFELAEKIQARDLIHLIASISDRMETVSDRIDIMLAKRNL